ncbi:universal stress protein [Rhodococcus sp. ARC_M6]|uniref:universal stress protein n=1 Tax=Rhodococcus sp. ARC_M6 TaxID=2928852 RepID=UPI001FB4E878|nr:universal stress protein [Rhodococcus sp. ARC_M6]MCJ0903317.1 universal stress protein [Rhodococcus sp. ARC_M6]
MRINPPVVVGFDGSAQSRDAVWWGARDAALRGAPLLLVTTIFTPTTYGVPIGMPATYFDEQEGAAKKRLTEASELAKSAIGKRELEIDVELAEDPPISVLRQISKTARTVVVGTRGHGEYTGGLVGSVSSSLAVHALCPVIVVRGISDDGLEDDTRPVVVGVDGTVHSQPAIAAAFEEASLRGVDLIAVHAWSDVVLEVVFSKFENVDWQARQDTERALLAESLAGFGDRYPDVSVNTTVVKDKPGQNLIDHSGRAQLIVLGRRGRGGFSGMLLGSTCREVLHGAQCPLMVVNSHR